MCTDCSRKHYLKQAKSKSEKATKTEINNGVLKFLPRFPQKKQ